MTVMANKTYFISFKYSNRTDVSGKTFANVVKMDLVQNSLMECCNKILDRIGYDTRREDFIIDVQALNNIEV